MVTWRSLEPYDPARTPKRNMGIVAETFWRLGACRASGHPTSSFAAQGFLEGPPLVRGQAGNRDRLPWSADDTARTVHLDGGDPREGHDGGRNDDGGHRQPSRGSRWPARIEPMHRARGAGRPGSELGGRRATVHR